MIGRHYAIGRLRLMDEGFVPLDDYDTEAHCGKPFP